MLCRHPAIWLPRLSASTAGPLNEPKLMPDTLTIDAGRNARGAPPGAAHHLRARNLELRIELRIARMIGRQGKGVVLDDEVVRLQLHLVVGAEAEVVVLALRRGVDPSSLVAAERPLLVVVGDDVLAELGTDRLQPVAEVPDDRERSAESRAAAASGRRSRSRRPTR